MPRLSKDQIDALRAKLSPEVEQIAFGEGTERAFSHPLYNEHRDGIYHCQVCENPLFKSDSKYESGSGWPSFWQPGFDNALDSKSDHKLALPRTEIHCDNCSAHLGHVFNDGPQPTGQRFCINGTALSFKNDHTSD